MGFLGAPLSKWDCVTLQLRTGGSRILQSGVRAAHFPAARAERRAQSGSRRSAAPPDGPPLIPRGLAQGPPPAFPSERPRRETTFPGVPRGPGPYRVRGGGGAAWGARELSAGEAVGKCRSERPPSARALPPSQPPRPLRPVPGTPAPGGECRWQLRPRRRGPGCRRARGDGRRERRGAGTLLRETRPGLRESRRRRPLVSFTGRCQARRRTRARGPKRPGWGFERPWVPTVLGAVSGRRRSPGLGRWRWGHLRGSDGEPAPSRLPLVGAGEA